MKKRLFTVVLLVLSALLLISNSFAMNKKELGVRNIEVENVDYNLEYLKEKYDIYNEDIDTFEINEIYDNKKDIVSNNTLEDDYKVVFNVYVNKPLLYFTFEYTVYENEIITLTSNVKVTLIEYNNDYYFSSDNGYIAPSSELINESNIGACLNFACAGFDELIGANQLTSGNKSSGGFDAAALGVGLGLLAAAAIYAQNSSTTITSHSVSSSSSSNSINIDRPKRISFDDVFKRDKIKDKMNELGTTKDKIKGIIEIMTGCLVEDIQKRNKKVMAIGRDLTKFKVASDNMSAYQNYADNNDCLRFFNENFGNLVKIYGSEAMELANEVLVIYCILDNWDFVLVTNPYHYMLEHFTGVYNGYAYRDEIALLRLFNYNKFKNAGITWETIPCPGFTKADYYQASFYYVSQE